MTWTHQRVVNSSQGIGSMKISHFSKMPYCVKWWWLKLTFGVISQRPFSKLQHLPNLPGMTRDFKWMKFVLSQILVFQAHYLMFRIIPIMFVLFLLMIHIYSNGKQESSKTVILLEILFTANEFDHKWSHCL